jgi:hypothetical protein
MRVGLPEGAGALDSDRLPDQGSDVGGQRLGLGVKPASVVLSTPLASTGLVPTYSVEFALQLGNADLNDASDW